MILVTIGHYQEQPVDKIPADVWAESGDKVLITWGGLRQEPLSAIPDCHVESFLRQLLKDAKDNLPLLRVCWQYQQRHCRFIKNRNLAETLEDTVINTGEQLAREQTRQADKESSFQRLLQRRLYPLMPFGAFKGQRLNLLPKDYIRWLAACPNRQEPLALEANRFLEGAE